MRIMMKGGLWTNTEDEVLKAAVMKYGKNQWDRTSSLLNRKSADQCKARWYEWLDPSIKKTDWTLQEDQKLLHLSKLMPAQWRTIAPIVGRTPSQCLERYERLLDAACTNDESYDDDPRKLRPGEIDPNPESKPARPDPVDMDEDVKEMISEARARLANTRGKKAKRKVRERQLEESRRLASLQKQRELKAAGFDDERQRRRKKRKGMDYKGEIPFEKKPPLGFYDVTIDEDRRPVEQPKFPTTIEELEGEKRMDKEAQLRKQDIGRSKIAERWNNPASKLDDLEPVRKRSKVMLPPPQISDIELEDIAKMSYADSDMLAERSGATCALLGHYGQAMTPLRTPQRTPSGKGDSSIMVEAENLARLRASQTLLLGGENPESHYSNSSGVIRDILTPKPILMPSGMTPKGTPIRDELHINENLEIKRRADHLKRSLHSGLSSLPQPKNEYQIVIQPAPEDNEEPQDMIEEDMSDRIARDKAEEEAKQQVLVLQRELPRPYPASFPTHNDFDLSSLSVEEKVGALRSEFEIVKGRMDDDTKKAQRLEQKVKLLTKGYKTRAGKIWSQIEATFRQMDTAGTELECFQALQKQEQEAASHRVNGIWEEVQKQKELELTLQKRYGDLIVELDGVRSLMDDTHRVQEEIACS